MLTEARSKAGQVFLVGLAELAVSRDPDIILRTCPLGACLGIAIFDPVVGVGGLLHSLLPESKIDLQRAVTKPGMFLDTGIEELLKRAWENGAKRENLRVVVAGGAQIIDETASFNIGKRNFDVLKTLLAQHGVPIYAQDVGGMTNRTIELNLATGEVRLKYSGHAKLKLLCPK